MKGGFIMDLYKRVMMKKKFDQGKEKVLGFKDELVAKAKETKERFDENNRSCKQDQLKIDLYSFVIKRARAAILDNMFDDIYETTFSRSEREEDGVISIKSLCEIDPLAAEMVDEAHEKVLFQVLCLWFADNDMKTDIRVRDGLVTVKMDKAKLDEEEIKVDTTKEEEA